MIENQIKSNSTTQSLEILELKKTQSQNTTQSIESVEIMDSNFNLIDTSQQIQNITKSSRIASPIKIEPQQKKNNQQVSEKPSIKLQQVEHKCISPLIEQIKSLTFDKKNFEEISSLLNGIENFKQEVIKYGIKQKIKQISKFEQQINNDCTEWENISQQGVKFFKFPFIGDSSQKKHKQKMIDNIRKFHSELVNFFTEGDCFTFSAYEKSGGCLQGGDINLTLRFTFHTYGKKSDPIDIDILHSFQDLKYQLFLKELAFLQKLQERMKKNKINNLQFWLDIVKKQIISNSNEDHCFLYYEFERDSKLIKLQGQIDRPLIITKDSCPIYLGQNMALQLEKNQQIIFHYAQFTSQAQNEKFCIQEQEKISSRILDNSKDLIKLEYTKQLQNNKLSKNYEFFLRNQQLELNPYLPQFKGVLKHDSNGFIIIPYENQRLKLHTDQTLLTTQRHMSFSLELNDDVWIEVEYDLDKQVFII